MEGIYNTPLEDPEWTEIYIEWMIGLVLASNVGFCWLVQNRHHNRKLHVAEILVITILGFTVGTLLFQFIAICFGAPLLTNVSRTLHFGALLSAFSFLSPCLFMGFDTNQWIRVYANHSPKNKLERFLYYTGYGSVIGAWLGAIPIPLDSDRPYQVWPVSCVYGATGGYILGVFIWFISLGGFRKDHKD
eukprot:TRINITY_DN6218_c0_g1_i2.p1 TRINITY_DN6218_c0_g1~~TRINITY_DN6218_c0_g1_i2.p1  ORF type:complete len:189 (-),score=21.00 TRINITY_DN6218_c0_g1_i2:85-651(-)